MYWKLVIKTTNIPDIPCKTLGNNKTTLDKTNNPIFKRHQFIRQGVLLKFNEPRY